MGTRLPAGWYADPADNDQYRYWSGEHWTTHTRNRFEVDLTADPANRPLPDFDAVDAPPAAATDAKKRRRLPSLLAVVALVAVLATAGVVAFRPAGGSGPQLTGEIRVRMPSPPSGGGFVGDGGSCGDEPNRGVGTGTPVRLTSARGAELGSTELGEGRLDRTLTSTTCVFTYAVDVQDDANVFVLEVGDRKARQLPRSRVEAAGWTLDARIG